MLCEDVRQSLESFVDDELPVSQGQAVERHLGSCPTCAGLLANRLRFRTAVLGAMVVTAPPALRTAVSKATKQIIRTPFRSRAGRAVLAVAATLLLTVATMIHLRGRVVQPAPFQRPAPVIVLGAEPETKTPGRLVLAGRL